MAPAIRLPPALQQGVGGLAGIARFDAVGPWRWLSQTRQFALRCRATLELDPNEFVPRQTDWILRVSADYPDGEVLFYPAAAGGLVHTFPHQDHNGAPAPGTDWRTGKPCLEDRAFIPVDPEPTTPDARLRWRVLRLLDWLDAAATGRLMVPGDRLEFPQLPKARDIPSALVFAEDTSTYPTWMGRAGEAGSVDLIAPAANPRLWAVRCFRNSTGAPMMEPSWGTGMKAASPARAIKGLWFLFPEPPVVEPWGWPTTWGELQALADRHGVPLMETIAATARQLRSGQTHPLLVGFPTAEIVGSAAVRIHWLALMLPVLSHGRETARGFRHNEVGYARRDAVEVFRVGAKLEWILTSNWAADQMTGRGVLVPRIEEHRFLLIGAGALGAPVIELIARGGGRRFEIVDGDVLEGGNLVRHSLGISGVARGKAAALAARLREISPHVIAEEIVGQFAAAATRNAERVEACDVIIDCTAEEGVLDDLKAQEWETEKLFVSLSLGWCSRRLFCFAARGFSFPAEDFRERLAPWLQRDRADREHLDAAPLWPTLGCWHPVFPASAVDVMSMAATGVQFIRRALKSDLNRMFSVFEAVGGECFEGIREVTLDEANDGETGSVAERSALLVA